MGFYFWFIVGFLSIFSNIGNAASAASASSAEGGAAAGAGPARRTSARLIHREDISSLSDRKIAAALVRVVDGLPYSKDRDRIKRALTLAAEMGPPLNGGGLTPNHGVALNEVLDRIDDKLTLLRATLYFRNLDGFFKRMVLGMLQSGAADRLASVPTVVVQGSLNEIIEAIRGELNPKRVEALTNLIFETFHKTTDPRTIHRDIIAETAYEILYDMVGDRWWPDVVLYSITKPNVTSQWQRGGGIVKRPNNVSLRALQNAMTIHPVNWLDDDDRLQRLMDRFSLVMETPNPQEVAYGYFAYFYTLMRWHLIPGSVFTGVDAPEYTDVMVGPVSDEGVVLEGVDPLPLNRADRKTYRWIVEFPVLPGIVDVFNRAVRGVYAGTYRAPSM